MTIITLPQQLQLAAQDSIQVYDYRSLQSSRRSKISLSKNTFSFLKEGTKELITADHSTRIEPDQFLVMKAGNCLMTETVSAAQQSYKSILLFFSDDILLNFIERQQLKLQPTNVEQSFQVCRYDDYILHFVESLAQISKLAKSLQDRLLKAKFEEIMIYLLQKEGANFINSLLPQHDQQAIQLRRVVENNQLKKLSLQELSFLCNMSQSTFKRAFFKQYQQSPIKWFQERRLEHAAFLLRSQKKKPSEVYEAAGYDSLSNFIQAFKKKFALTPKQFQQQE